MREQIKNRIDNYLVHLYSNAISPIKFPIIPEKVIEQTTNCKLLSYSEIAETSGCSISDVISVCGSDDGCTYYDVAHNRYLITFNSCGRNTGRIRWTISHELGHICAGHFIELVNSGRSDASPSEHDYMEEEADYFAATFLAPFQAIKVSRARSSSEIRMIFGLSQTAAERRWTEYNMPREKNALDKYLTLSKKFYPASYTPTFSCHRGIDVWNDGPQN